MGLLFMYSYMHLITVFIQIHDKFPASPQLAWGEKGKKAPHLVIAYSEI